MNTPDKFYEYTKNYGPMFHIVRPTGVRMSFPQHTESDAWDMAFVCLRYVGTENSYLTDDGPPSVFRDKLLAQGYKICQTHGLLSTTRVLTEAGRKHQDKLKTERKALRSKTLAERRLVSEKRKAKERLASARKMIKFWRSMEKKRLVELKKIK